MDHTIAVVGNPNVGKSTLFNALTGLSQVTGNYPGVTVERKSGRMRVDTRTYHLIDLPGTYSLAARSPDEMIVVDVLLGRQPGERPVDAVVAVMDASNLERNLYLVSQLRELNLPLVVALNMMDVARKRGLLIDVQALSDHLGVPVVAICAHRREGVPALKDALDRVVREHTVPAAVSLPYPPAFQTELEGIEEDLRERQDALGHAAPRLEAIRVLVDRDGYIERQLGVRLNGSWAAQLETRRQRASADEALSEVETRARYSWIASIAADVVERPAHHVETFSDRIDALLTNRFWGGLVFAVLMAAVFQAIYTWSAPFMDLIDQGFGALGEAVRARMSEGVLTSLLVDGVIAGVGSVVVFVPQILILTFFIALLEDLGYMARAAFLMDKLFSKCGLSGQCFIPLLSSFACAIPGVMATRIIGERRDRLATMLIAPLMSCSARLPVYTVLIGAFIPNKPILGNFIGLQGLTLLALYALGVAVAVPMAWLLKKTLLRGETPPFLLELPSYKCPQFRVVLQRVWTQGLEFLRKAGTTICAITILVWALGYFPRSEEIQQRYEGLRAETVATVPAGDVRDEALATLDRDEAGENLRHSYLARMGQVVEPVVTPLGWDWRIGMATLASFPAREIIIATLGTLFNLGADADGENFQTALAAATRPDGSPLFNIAVALSVMVFFALCCQCGATLVIIQRETQSWRWPLFTFGYMTVLAYVAAFVTYRAALALGLGA